MSTQTKTAPEVPASEAVSQTKNVHASSLAQFQQKAQGKVTQVENISFKKQELPTYKITLGFDTEYVQRVNHSNKMLTTQVALSDSKDDCIVLEHPFLGIGRLPVWNGSHIISDVLGWDEITEVKPDAYLILEHLMFFAPSDLFAGCFKDKNLCRKVQRYCKQDARIRLETDEKKHKNMLPLPICLDTPMGVAQVVLKVVDLGKLSVGGLADNVAAFGGKMLDKGKMDAYKTNMLEPYTTEDSGLFADYLEYAKDDACQLFFLRKANEERTKMLFGTHDLPIPEREIVTTGSLVATLFQTYLEKYIGEYKAYSLFEFQDLTSDGRVKTWRLEKMLEQATVKYFAEKTESRKAALALVQGGRAKNEQPLVIKQTGVVADVDISGAYVTIQQALTYPVGLPVTYGQHESSKRKITLGQFLKNNDGELLPRLWVAVVSGNLKHHQTLVPSKVIDSLKVSEKYNEDDPKIPADFRLYTKEIINGVITSDVLETLKNVCSKFEFKEWLDLELVSAAWYPKSLMCETPEQWYEKTLRHKQETGNSIEETVNKKGETFIADKRSRYWLAVPLKKFLAPYAKKRKELKALMNSYEKGTPEYIALDAQQTAMKLVGNTNYGVLASPYFPVGNVVISNNITAAARVAVWLTSVALGCVQSITDGGAYNLNAVRTWHTQKPTMNTISLMRDLSKLGKPKRYVGTKALGTDKTWEVSPGKVSGKDRYSILTDGEQSFEAKESGWSYLDKVAIEHVREYFQDSDNPITILDVISYEHKDIYQKILYCSQTNYQAHHVTGGTPKTKARGHKVKGNPYENGERSNIHSLFEALDNDPHHIPPYRQQYISQILKCNQANEMLESKSENIYKENDLLAGDSILKRSWVRPLSLSMFHWQNDKQYKSWERTANSLKEKTGWGLEQYFLNPDGTVDYVKAVTTIQDYIDMGQDWLFPYGHRGSVKELIKATHPYLENTNIPEADPED